MAEGSSDDEGSEMNIAVDFIIRMVHKYPGEVTIWAGGPPDQYRTGDSQGPCQVGLLSRELVLMGGGFNDLAIAGIQRENGMGRVQLVVRSGGRSHCDERASGRRSR